MCLAKADLGCFFLDVMMVNIYVSWRYYVLADLFSFLCRNMNPCDTIIEALSNKSRDIVVAIGCNQ